MKKIAAVIVLGLFLSCGFLSVNLFAARYYGGWHGGYYGGYYGWRGGYYGWRGYGGPYWGWYGLGPWWGLGYPYGYPYYAYPYANPYAYPYSAYPSAQLPTPSEPQQSYWYYCQNPQGYYPYVRDCPGGWTQVVPTPPQSGREGAAP